MTKLSLSKSDCLLISADKTQYIVSNVDNPKHPSWTFATLGFRAAKMSYAVEAYNFRNCLESMLLGNEHAYTVELPVISEAEMWITLSREEIKLLLTFCDETSDAYYKTCVAVTATGVVASNSLSLVRLVATLNLPQFTNSYLLPKQNLKRMLDLSPTCGSFKLHLLKNEFCCVTDAGYFKSGYVAGQYPPFESIFGLEYEPLELDIELPVLTSAVIAIAKHNCPENPSVSIGDAVCAIAELKKVLSAKIVSNPCVNLRKLKGGSLMSGMLRTTNVDGSIECYTVSTLA